MRASILAQGWLRARVAALLDLSGLRAFKRGADRKIEMLNTDQIAVPLDELKKTAEWQDCTPKQQFWLERFIESGDPTLATAETYKCSSARNCKILSYEIPQQVRVRAVLDLYYGRTNREAFLNKLQRQIETGDLSIAQIEATKFLCSLRGWMSPTLPNIHGRVSAGEHTASSAPKLYKVGDTCTQDGIAYRITEVNADGTKILNAVEVEHV